MLKRIKMLFLKNGINHQIKEKTSNQIIEVLIIARGQSDKNQGMIVGQALRICYHSESKRINKN